MPTGKAFICSFVIAPPHFLICKSYITTATTPVTVVPVFTVNTVLPTRAGSLVVHYHWSHVLGGLVDDSSSPSGADEASGAAATAVALGSLDG